MHKTLIKFYILFVIAFCIFINIFPNIFININNGVDYIKVKTLLTFKNNMDNGISIYKNKGNVIIMLDDGWKTQYTIAYNYMHQKNMRGSISIIPSAIDEKDYLNKSDLISLYNDNWDLLNHTYSHAILSKSTIKKQIEEISKGGSWLEENNFANKSNILIYPEGQYNDNTITAMKKLNYISGRTVDDGFNSKEPDSMYNIHVKNVLSTTNPNDVNEWINYAIDNNLTLILLFHKLENEVDESLMKYKINDFYKIIDYMDKRKNDLNIITYTEWIQTITYNIK